MVSAWAGKGTYQIVVLVSGYACATAALCHDDS